jgi:hypothetical protein
MYHAFIWIYIVRVIEKKLILLLLIYLKGHKGKVIIPSLGFFPHKYPMLPLPADSSVLPSHQIVGAPH